MISLDLNTSAIWIIIPIVLLYCKPKLTLSPLNLRYRKTYFYFKNEIVEGSYEM